MKTNNLQKYYKHIQQVYCDITGREPISISQQTEQKIIKMFRQIEQEYDKLCLNRGKFLSYSYVLNKLFHMINMPDVANCFPLLKRKKHFLEHEKIFNEICTQLNWRVTQ